jgi:hypothetical protein
VTHLAYDSGGRSIDDTEEDNVKKGLVVALIALLVGLGTSCGGLLDDEVATADVGDCITNDIAGAVGEFDVVDCDETHTAELIFKFDMPDGDFPGAEAISAEAQEQCTGSNFEDYVGLDYASSEIVVLPVTPTEQTWNEADDREVLCFGSNLDASDLDETIQGSGR